MTNTGRLLAICDARYGTTADLPNDIDLVLKTSDNNGQTWSARQTIINTGSTGNSDPQILIDKTTGDIFVFYAYKVAWTSPIDKFHYIKSTDNGNTWSAPVDIKSSVFNTNDINMWAGPGNGIQLRNGLLVAPYSLNSQGIQDSIQTCFIYSDDHGATWNQSLGKSGTGLEEPTMVELNNRDLMLNARSRRGATLRGISYTQDSGAIWTPTYDHPDLLDPIVQGSMIRYTSIIDGYAKNRLLFSNPSHPSNRENLTVFISYDEGITWPVKKVIDAGGSGYSSLAILDNGDIGILYERQYGPHGLFGIIYPNHVSFRKMTLSELTNGMDSLCVCDTPSVPVAMNPSPSSIKLSWHTKSGSYNLEYKDTSSSVWTVISNVTSPYTLSGLNSLTVYDARIRWTCSDSSIFASDEISFQTDAATGFQEPFIQRDDIEIYPNPVVKELSLKLTTKLKDGALLRITDVYGQELYRKKLAPNQDAYSLDLERLPQGVYFLQLSNKKGSLTKQFSLVR
ncbi:MAG: T9SS type A sorting domain-containing protein [Aureispira sp.]|nr:T9SS type A sorting domain-containing protein [Aureispira sp.]